MNINHVQALIAMQKTPEDELLSWYQVSGIQTHSKKASQLRPFQEFTEDHSYHGTGMRNTQRRQKWGIVPTLVLSLLFGTGHM